MSTETTYQVAVHKAALPLAKGESVNEFTQALSEAGRTYVMGQMRMDPAKDYCYSVTVYPETVVMACSIYSATKSRYPYVSMSYTRDTETKVFTFSDLVEVEQVTTYRPKSTMKITKGVDGDQNIEVFNHGEGAPGFQPVAKSFWSGLV